MTSLDEAIAPVTTVPHATRNEDLVTALCGTAMVLGVLSDSWAHTNILKTLDGFFTPWHALLYTGFAATGAWTFFLAYRRRHLAPEWWRDGCPRCRELRGDDRADRGTAAAGAPAPPDARRGDRARGGGVGVLAHLPRAAHGADGRRDRCGRRRRPRRRPVAPAGQGPRYRRPAAAAYRPPPRTRAWLVPAPDLA